MCVEFPQVVRDLLSRINENYDESSKDSEVIGTMQCDSF